MLNCHIDLLTVNNNKKNGHYSDTCTAGNSTLARNDLLRKEQLDQTVQKTYLLWRCSQVGRGCRKHALTSGSTLEGSRNNMVIFLLNPSGGMFLRPVMNCKISHKFALDFPAISSSTGKYAFWYMYDHKQLNEELLLTIILYCYTIDIIPPCTGVGNGTFWWGHGNCARYGAIFHKTSVYWLLPSNKSVYYHG